MKMEPRLRSCPSQFALRLLGDCSDTALRGPARLLTLLLTCGQWRRAEGCGASQQMALTLRTSGVRMGGGHLPQNPQMGQVPPWSLAGKGPLKCGPWTPGSGWS